MSNNFPDWHRDLVDIIYLGLDESIMLEDLPDKTSLYCCSFERNKSLDGQKFFGAYAVRFISLRDLLSFDDPGMKLKWRQVGYRAGEDLPAEGGCGVLGSQIVFAGGLKRNYGSIEPPFRYDSSPPVVYGYDSSPPVVYGYDSSPPVAYGYDSSRQGYAYDTKESKHKIVTMDATLQLGKHEPLMAEVAGKLYALSGKPFVTPTSFEVFDPTHGNWSLLPEPPYAGGNLSSYAVVGTKFFVSNENSPVFCFDVAAAHPGWKTVPSMCQGGSFPFLGKALVLDLPELEHHNRKIMFTAMNFDDSSPRRRRRLLVYLMSLYENQESITPIHELQLPELPEELPDESSHYHFLHLGGRTVCLVITGFQDPDEDEPYEPGTHNISGAAIPFQFDFDISMVDKDKENCFTVQFLPHRILEYHTNPSSLPYPDTLGCFVL